MASVIRNLVRSYKRNKLENRLREATGNQVKVANAELNWREFWHGQTELRSFPRQIQVGTNWTCNLRCNFCRLTLEETQKQFKALPPRELEISDHVFQTVCDLMPYPETMTLTPLGEPLLYSKFGKLLEHHRQLGSENLAMTTNANLINDDRARMIVEGQMSHLFVSVDSSDPEIYAGMRVRGSLDKVEEAMEAINRWKDKLNSKLPTMTLASTFMERNVRQMTGLLEFALRHRFDTFNLQLMEVENPELSEEFLGNHVQLLREMLLNTLKKAEGQPIVLQAEKGFQNLLSAHLSNEELKAISSICGGREDDVTSHLGTKGTTLIQKCHYPWYFLLIDTDGDSRPCCWTGMTYGNQNGNDFMDVWNGDAARKMRQDFLNNHIPKACQKKHCRVDLDHHGTME